MLNAIEHFIHPGQRVFLNIVNRLEIELGQTAIADIANIIFHFLAFQTFNTAHFKSQIDKGIFMRDHGLAGLIQVFFQLVIPNMRIFLNKGIEQLDRRIGVQRFITRRPGYDLAHAFHFIEAREIHQNGEAGKQLQPLGETAKYGQSFGNIFIRLNAPFLHIVVFILHLAIFHKGFIFDFRHADGIEQMRIGGNVNGFHIGKCSQHHLNFGRLKHLAVMLHIAIIDFDIGLHEKAEDLRQQIALRTGQFLVPIFHIFGQWHFFRQPVNPLLRQPGIICPRIAERFIDNTFFKQRHFMYLFSFWRNGPAD